MKYMFLATVLFLQACAISQRHPAQVPESELDEVVVYANIHPYDCGGGSNGNIGHSSGAGDSFRAMSNPDPDRECDRTSDMRASIGKVFFSLDAITINISGLRRIIKRVCTDENAIGFKAKSIYENIVSAWDLDTPQLQAAACLSVAHLQGVNNEMETFFGEEVPLNREFVNKHLDKKTVQATAAVLKRALDSGHINTGYSIQLNRWNNYASLTAVNSMRDEKFKLFKTDLSEVRKQLYISSFEQVAVLNQHNPKINIVVKRLIQSAQNRLVIDQVSVSGEEINGLSGAGGDRGKFVSIQLTNKYGHGNKLPQGRVPTIDNPYDASTFTSLVTGTRKPTHVASISITINGKKELLEYNGQPCVLVNKQDVRSWVEEHYDCLEN